MAFSLTAGGLVVVRIWCVDGAQASVNRINYNVGSIGTIPATDQDVATQIEAVVAPLYKQIMSLTAVFRGVQAQITAPPPLTSAAGSNVFAGAGTAGPIGLPRQSCGLTTVRTNLAGRRYRGRIFWPFPSTAHAVGSGDPSSSYQADIEALANYLLNPIAVSQGGRTATINPILIHGEGKSPTPPPSAISGFETSGSFATQRRRSAFGRPNASPL